MSLGFAVLCLSALAGSVACLYAGVGWPGVAVLLWSPYVLAVVEDVTVGPPSRGGRRGGRGRR